MLSYFDVQSLIVIKLCLVLFVGGGIVWVYYKLAPWGFLVVTGVLSAVAYLALTAGLRLPFWGLQGDEVTIVAMYNTFAHYGLHSDFAYHALPPFYPPAFFWLFALIGKLWNWNGVVIAKFSAAVTYLLFPTVTYWLQKLYWRTQPQSSEAPGNVAMFLAPLLVLMVISQDAIFGKPYELVTAVATIFWAAFLFRESTNPSWRWYTGLLFGVAAGLIFMTYYLWLMFAAIAIALLGLGVKKELQWRFYARLVLVGIVALLTSLPYLGPLLLAYHRSGVENWQTALFTVPGLNLWLPTAASLTWPGIAMAGGFVVLLVYRKNSYIRSLLVLYSTAYIWWVMGLTTVLLFRVPMQEFRGFSFFAPSILAIGLAYGLERAWIFASTDARHDRWWHVRSAAAVLGLLLVASQLLFGFFVDDPVVQQRLVQSRELRPDLAALVDWLEHQPASRDKITLYSVPELAAYVPMNNFLYYNQHNNHPAAQFSARWSYVQALVSASDPKSFYQQVHSGPLGPIERIIAFHYQGKYYLYFHLDELVSGIREEEVAIPERLLSPEYFNTVYDSTRFVVFETR